MSRKKLLEFGLKEADAFQKNFKIIFDRLVRGYKSMMGREPEGLDLLKVKMEARQKALDSTKVVNQKGLTLDPDKPIIGGTQEGIETIKTKFYEEDFREGLDTIKDQMDKIKSTSSKLDEVIKEREAMFKPKPDTDEFNLSKDDPMGDLEKIIKGEGDTGLPKNYTRPFGDNIRDAYSKAGRSREDATEMIKALDSPGARKSYEIMEEVLGVRLYGDETFEELMKIKETGVHPRGEPPIKKADGGRIGFSRGGESIIGQDMSTIGGLMGGPPAAEDDEFSDIAGQTAGLGVLSGLKGLLGSRLGEFVFNKGRQKVIDKITQEAVKKAREIELAKEAKRAREATAAMAAANRAAGRGGYQSSFGRDTGFMEGRGTAAEMGSFADGGLATMFVEKR